MLRKDGRVEGKECFISPNRDCNPQMETHNSSSLFGGMNLTFTPFYVTRALIPRCFTIVVRSRTDSLRPARNPVNHSSISGGSEPTRRNSGRLKCHIVRERGTTEKGYFTPLISVGLAETYVRHLSRTTRLDVIKSSGAFLAREQYYIQ